MYSVLSYVIRLFNGYYLFPKFVSGATVKWLYCVLSISCMVYLLFCVLSPDLPPMRFRCYSDITPIRCL